MFLIHKCLSIYFELSNDLTSSHWQRRLIVYMVNVRLTLTHLSSIDLQPSLIFSKRMPTSISSQLQRGYEDWLTLGKLMYVVLPILDTFCGYIHLRIDPIYVSIISLDYLYKVGSQAKWQLRHDMFELKQLSYEVMS